MTRVGSSWEPESSMDDAVNALLNPRKARASAVGAGDCGGGGEEVWETFSKSFSQVQSVLDRNRLLIQQVNENHQSRVSGNLVKNVALIQELNNNVSKVASLYSDLSSNFSTMVPRRNPSAAGSGTGTSDGSSKKDDSAN